jgi:transcriptional regulator with XRE-family HTH domain
MASPARRIRKSVLSPAQLAFRELMVTTRKKNGLSQQDVADRLGKPQSFVAKYENGERRIDIIEFITIARAIGADPVGVLKCLIKRGA